MTIELISQKLCLAEELVGNDEYAEALALVETVDVVNLDSESRIRYYTVLSRCLHFLGEYSRALDASLESLSLLSDRKGKEYALQRHLHGKILQKLGKLSEAIEAYTESFACLENAGDHEGASFSLDSLSSLHYLKGDFAAAERALDFTVNYCLSHGLVRNLSKCRNNQARVLLMLGDTLRAGATLRAVLRDDISDNVRHSATYLLGMVAMFRREHLQAGTLLSCSLKYYRLALARREQVVCLEYLGLNEHFSGNQEKAKEYFQGILARDQITASARAQTLRMLTDVYIAEGNYSEALTTADQAEVAITKINERIEVGCLHRSRTRIAAATGNEPEARRQFAASVEMLQMIGAQYELAETYLLGGQLDLFEIKSRHEFLKQAVLLFVKCGVTVRANVASQQLSRLLPPVPDRGEDFSSPLASAYVACQLLKTDWQ